MSGYSLRVLRQTFPDAHRRWSETGTLLAAIGYTMVTTVAAATEARTNPAHVALLAAATAAQWMAHWTARRVDPHRGAATSIAVLAAEVHLSFAMSPGMPPAGLLATPLIAITATLTFGARVAGWLTAACVAATTPLLLLSPALGGRAPSSDDWFMLVLHAVVSMASWAIVSLGLSALETQTRALTDRERELALLVDAAPDGIVVVAADDRILAANPAAEGMLRAPGIRSRALDPVTRGDDALAPVLLAAGATDTTTLADALRDAEPHPTVVPLVVADAAGHPVHLEVSVNLLPVGHRQLMLRDVSSRERDEALRRAAGERLAHAQRLEAVGRMAGGIAHDMNNLLLVIGGSAEMLRAESDDQQRMDLLDELLAAHDRGAALAAQLLAFSRKDVVGGEPQELGALLQRSDRLLERVAGEGVHLRCEIEGDLWVRVDAAQLEQVVVNLVANARDAMSAGGVCSVRARAIASGDGQADVQLVVEDEGMGMDAATASRALEPFFTTKPRGRGTGLGLSTVHGIVRSHGGSMHLDTAPGRGTRVVVRLPRSTAGDTAGAPDAIASPVTAVPEPGAVIAGDRVVLVAEDDDSTRAVVARILRRGGYQALLAPNGAEALRILERQPERIALLLSDVVMPVIDGPTLARRARAIAPSLPVLFMSGYPDEALGDVQRLERDGAFLAKPFTSAVLLARVADTIARAAAKAGA